MNAKRPLRFQSLELRRLLAAVDIPDTLSGSPAAIVSVPVNIDVATGVRGAEIRLRYDTSLLNLDESRVIAGSVWDAAGDTQVTANVDEANGTVVVFISSSVGLTTSAGSLIEFGFSIVTDAVVGSTTVLDLTQVTLNEGQIPVTPAPQVGPDPTDGLITIRAAGTADRIGGFVYADTNNNNASDTLEGIPGVVVTLINVATGQQAQATTLADGSYEFTGLAPGNFTIRQQQPVAYIEGGPNEIAVTLVDGQALANQNFRELGLRPQFIYNRLLTTTVLPVGSSAWTNQLIRINLDATSGTVAPAPTPASAPANATDPASASVLVASAPSTPFLVQSQGSAEGESFGPLGVPGGSFHGDEEEALRRARAIDEAIDELHATDSLW